VSGEPKSVRDAYDRLIGAKSNDGSDAWPHGEPQQVRDAYDRLAGANGGKGGAK
jgi:hypothetical protein